MLLVKGFKDQPWGLWEVEDEKPSQGFQAEGTCWFGSVQPSGLQEYDWLLRRKKSERRLNVDGNRIVAA